MVTIAPTHRRPQQNQNLPNAIGIMEFLDNDTRPRFLFQSQAKSSSASKSQAYQKPNKPFLFFTISLSCLFFTHSIFYLQYEPFRSILIWLSLTLLIGPFALISITGGYGGVGHGSIVEFPGEEATINEDTIDEDANKRSSHKRSKARRFEDIAIGLIVSIDSVNVFERAEKKNQGSTVGENGVVLKEEKDWTEEDIEILKNTCRNIQWENITLIHVFPTFLYLLCKFALF